MRFDAFAVFTLRVVRGAAHSVQAVSAIATVKRVGHVLQRIVVGIQFINTAATTQQTPIVAFTAMAQARYEHGCYSKIDTHLKPNHGSSQNFRFATPPSHLAYDAEHLRNS
jgi:hypothetical protein